MHCDADRLAALPRYLFVEIDRKRAAAQAAGRDVIDFGVGDPDQSTPDFILAAMEHAIRRPEWHRYPSGWGLPAFRRQVAAFLAERYGVSVDPQREVLTLIGSKEGLGHLPLAVVNPGQAVLVPDPGYPVYRAATVLAGGTPFSLPLTEQGGWLPDLGAVAPDTARAAVLLFLNYPNNPTGATATRAFFDEAVSFARRYDLLIAHDAAYSELYLGDERPPSILEIPGAREVAVEFHSLSKTFNMTGWRLGFAVGNADVLDALARVKSNLDSGVFSAIQAAGIAAYAGCDRPEIARLRATYTQRAEILCAGLRAGGFRVNQPTATFYVWAGVPAGHDSLSTATRLLDEADVVCIPGSGFGPSGEGYVRFALTVRAERTRAAVERLAKIKWQAA